ncbi:MAG: colanic acid biosynthesis glycosyltransferase WcaL [Desulfobacterales bacterium RIFOXYA12_FULL_46_15]|nr:MAG: colanic acid biosynthesis glycosyltransferase WcaL [Desulfobacterales bacterium RIFOXYA12_FULL_46_15]
MENNVPPTLCMVLKGYPRISETFISNEILLLESLGFSIHIISMREPRESFTHSNVGKIKAAVQYLPSTILGHLLPLGYHNLMLALKRPGVYFKALKTAAARWRRTKTSATIKHLLQAGYLVHHCLPGKHIIHFQAHFAHSPTSVAMFSSILSGVPFSFFAHAKDIYTSDPRQLREKMDMARFVVTCTRYNQKYLNTLAGKGNTSVFCVYHGINPNYFSPQPKSILCTPPYKILTVARMTEKKGLDIVYKALAILRDRGVKFKHTLIGEGQDNEKIVQIIKALSLESVTTLAGTLPHEAVISYYAEADLFVLGCKIAADGDRDGIPNVMAESMAMNVPVAAPKVSGIPEFLEDGITGKMVPENDPYALASAMELLLTDEALRQKVIPKARERIIREFNNKELIHDLARIYCDRIPGLMACPGHPPK